MNNAKLFMNFQVLAVSSPAAPRIISVNDTRITENIYDSFMNYLRIFTLRHR